MSRWARQSAAIQMDRDSIRSLTPKQRARTLCGHVFNPGELIILRCHKRAGYATPIGNRCFTHALALRSDPPK